MKRALGNPHRRGDNGATKNACRLKHARPECDLPQYSKRRVYDMYSELNIEGRNIFQSTTIEEYTKLCDAQASRQQQERAVPQHLACGTAHPHWLAFREEDPHNPAGPRPISSSDVLCILVCSLCSVVVWWQVGQQGQSLGRRFRSTDGQSRGRRFWCTNGGAIGQNGKTDETCMRGNGCRRISENVAKQQTRTRLQATAEAPHSLLPCVRQCEAPPHEEAGA